MKHKGSIYLAGPEVFLPDANEYFEKAKEICESNGYIGICPFDGEPIRETGLKKADLIFKNNCRLIESADLVIANCNVFRGALVDDGTSFEIGYAYALKKRIYGLIEKRIPLPQIVNRNIVTYEHISGYPIDERGYLVNEDFGNSINLMMEMAIQNSGGELFEGNLEGLLQSLENRLTL